MTADQDMNYPPRALVAIILTGIASVMTAGLKPILITLYIARAGLSQQTAGLILAAEMLAAAAGAALVSVFVVRLGWRRLALIGLLLLLVGDLACVAWPPLDALIAIRIVAGLGSGLAAGTMAAALSGTSAPDRWMGIYNGIALMILAAGFIVIPAVVVGADMRAAFVVLAATAVPALLTLGWFPRRPDVPQSNDARAPTTVLPRGSVVLLAGILFYYLALGGVYPFLAEIGRRSGWDVREVGFILSASQIVGAGGSFLPALLGVRIGRGTALIIAIGAAIAALMALLIGDPVIFAIAANLFVGASMMTFAYAMGLVGLLDPLGRVAGLAFAVQVLCLGAGPAWAGFVVGHFGSVVLILVCTLFAAAALFTLVPMAFRQQRQAVAA